MRILAQGTKSQVGDEVWEFQPLTHEGNVPGPCQLALASRTLSGALTWSRATFRTVRRSPRAVMCDRPHGQTKASYGHVRPPTGSAECSRGHMRPPKRSDEGLAWSCSTSRTVKRRPRVVMFEADQALLLSHALRFSRSHRLPPSHRGNQLPLRAPSTLCMSHDLYQLREAGVTVKLNGHVQLRRLL